METTYGYSGQEDLLRDTFDSPPEYAGFWLRFAAYIIDSILIYTGVFILALVFGMNIPGIASESSTANEFIYLFLFLAMLSYFPIMESSKWQATLGKRAVGIRVTDMFGARIDFGKAVLRFLGKILSSITLCIGYFMAGFTEKKQALHDMIANTLVVRV